MKCEAINLSKYIGKSPNIFFIFGSEIILKNHVKSRILETLASRGFSEKIILSDENFKEIKSTIAANAGGSLFSSKLITHDVYNKRLDLYKYDYLCNFDKDIHPDNGESNPIISEAKDPDTHKNLTEHEDTKLFVVSTASGYSFSEGENYPFNQMLMH